MHLIIPYAASQQLGTADALAGLQLPHLQALLAVLQRQHTEQKDDKDRDRAPDSDAGPRPLNMPHERLHTRALGWDTSKANASLPWAAWQTRQTAQTAADSRPQAWMTPCHWQIGMDQVVMADPAHLHLSDDESQQLLHAMQPFLQEDGLQVTWHSALLWHAQGDMLADLACASLDRVIGQNVKPWLPEGPAARALQRLQSEMQMLIYNHPVNDAREARRQHTVNAFWLHGAGTLPANTAATTPAVHVPENLRASALRGDVQAWRQAWQQLDATAVADLLAHFKATGQAMLSLCSEHAAHTYTAAPAGWHQRTTRAFQRLFNKATPAAALQALITA